MHTRSPFSTVMVRVTGARRVSSLQQRMLGRDFVAKVCPTLTGGSHLHGYGGRPCRSTRGATELVLVTVTARVPCKCCTRHAALSQHSKATIPAFILCTASADAVLICRPRRRECRAHSRPTGSEACERAQSGRGKSTSTDCTLYSRG